MDNKKRLQLALSPDAWAAVDALVREANSNFETGSINFSDMVNEMILSAKVDVKILQLKHTDIRRSLRVMAALENIDLDTAIRTLTEIKQKLGKKPAKSLATQEDTNE